MRVNSLGRLRLQLLPDISAHSLISFVSSNAVASTIVHSDGWVGYTGFRAAGFDHRPHI